MIRFLMIVFALLMSISAADAAVVRTISTASGNIDSTGTWSVIDTTGTNAFFNSNTGATIVTTGFVASQNFTPATETITGFAIKLNALTGTTGSITAKLTDTTASSDVCTPTAINLTNLVSSAAQATDEGGWIVFGGCSVSASGHTYAINVETSNAAQVTLWRSSATAGDWSHFLVTSGTESNGPQAGDQFNVMGQFISGSLTSYIVTIETTSGVTYGSETNFSTTTDPAIAVGQGGTLCIGSAGTCGPVASTAYVFQFAGQEVTYNGGTVSFGTAGSPVPASGSAAVTQEVTAEGSTGINTRNGGTLNVAGSSGGRSVVKTKLAATATGGVTSTLTMADSTGWLSGDQIAIAATSITTASQASYKYDTGTLSGNASGTSVTLTGTVTNNHTAVALSYTSTSTGTPYAMNMFADVVLLNRNVVIQGSGSTTNGYLYFQASANAAMTWVEFSAISGLTAGKRGIEADVGPSGSFSLTYFSIINSHESTLVLAPTNTSFGGTSGSYLTVQHGGLFNVTTTASTAQANYGLGVLTASTNPFFKIDDVAIIYAGNGGFASYGAYIVGQNFQFTNIAITGASTNAVGAINLVASYSNKSIIGGQVGNTWGPISLYTNIGYPLSISGGFGITGTINGMYIWHEQGRFELNFGLGSLIIDPFYMITSGFGIYDPSPAGANLTVRNGVIGWDINQASATFPMTVDSVNNSRWNLDNMELCPVGLVGGVTFLQCGGGGNDLVSLMHDVTAGSGYVPSSARVFLRNTSMLNNSGTAYPSLGGEEGFYGRAFVVQDCAACSPVKHAAWVAGGFINYDTTIYHTIPYSMRMTPRVTTFSGYISGTALTVTSGAPGLLGDSLTSNGSNFVVGTNIVSGAGTSYVVSIPQTVGSAGTPVQFQSYYNNGSLLRMQSAPIDAGTKIAVANGQTVQVCVWLRPSSSGDAPPPWGGSAVTYTGDQPRMIVRKNPYMNVQNDTVLATASLSAGVWSPFCATTPVAPADGIFEIVVDADQTFTSNPGGSVNVAEWSTTN
jgi:hypothetical protein